MDGQLLELKSKNLLKNVSVLRPSSVFCTALEQIDITTYIGLACLQQFKRKDNYQEYYVTKI